MYVFNINFFKNFKKTCLIKKKPTTLNFNSPFKIDLHNRLLNFKKKVTMATKRLVLAIMLFAFVQTLAVSQSTNWGWDWKDSSKVSVKNQPQYREFVNNAFPYPAKPKDQWEIGIGLAAPILSGDMGNSVGFGGILTARKALSHVFSFRPYISYYNISGGPKDPNPSFRDYKGTYLGIGNDVIVSLNTINSYRGNPKWNAYIIAGFGVLTANIERKIGTTFVPFDPTDYAQAKIGDRTAITPVLNAGGGLAYKVSDNFNIGVELKTSFSNYDWFDGISTPNSNSFDAFNVPQVRLNWNVGNKASRVQPLWWINPNNFVYNELNDPKHMKQRKPVLDDDDADGITNQFDLEPNTPAGAAVDAHGRAVDTDGDGVPDFKDKERLTPQKCFPVNNDGVGTCPEDGCCKMAQDKIKELQTLIETRTVASGTGAGNCSISNLPSVVFKSGGAKLSRENMKMLDAVAEQLRNNGGCKVKVIGHPKASSKSEQQKSYDRVEAIIKYLVEKQSIAESRFIFAYDGGDGDSNTIDLQATTEEGPNSVPAPHPNLKGKQNF